MNANTSPCTLSAQARFVPFARIHQVGLGLSTVRKIERYKAQQLRTGAQAVELVTWPDGVWCVLAVAPTKQPAFLQAFVFDEGIKSDAYQMARQLVSGGHLPLLRLSPDQHLSPLTKTPQAAT
ncbi:MAG: hypothetical protein JKY26_08965 [Pseudomonas sp.]|nr:hypothetical protein [Pseudomonas sp.]PHR10900.1 MAG: hypothetical protein COA41_20550 [Sphingopyxis sp.]